MEHLHALLIAESENSIHINVQKRYTQALQYSYARRLLQMEHIFDHREQILRDHPCLSFRNCAIATGYYGAHFIDKPISA
ncbi:MAG: hypothetical protein LBQ63_03695 [Deltaproteobacteria bacterium]|nr:hypothetical protein [Deltaproteobacteria bacterium]